MAYQEISSVTGMDQLLTLLATFMNNNGWTAGYTTWVSTSVPGVLTMSKSTFNGTVAYAKAVSFPSISALLDELTISNYLSGVGGATNIVLGAGGAFSTVWFFTDSSKTYVHVVTLDSAGNYNHFSFGEIDNLGNSSFCSYGTGNAWDITVVPNNPRSNYKQLGYVQNVAFSASGLDSSYDGGGSLAGTSIRPVLNTATHMLGGDVFPYNESGTASTAAFFLDYIFDMFNSTTTGGVHFHAIPLFVVLGTFDHIMGIMPDVRLCKISDLIEGQEIINSGDTWKVFPCIKRGQRDNLVGGSNPIAVANTLDLGFAYKKIA